MDVGKLYTFDDEFIVDVNYKFLDSSETGWWGEFVPMEYCRIGDGDGYVLKLNDGRRGQCSLKRRINRAVSGVPPLYHYNFRGRGPLE